MILLLLAFGCVAGLAAAAESFHPAAEPRPVLWCAVIIAFPIAASAVARWISAQFTRRALLALFVATYATILWPLGWASWTLEHLGWRGKPLASLLLLLAPAAALSLWAAPWMYRACSISSPAVRGATARSFARWLIDSARLVAVPLVILVTVTFVADLLTGAVPIGEASRTVRHADLVLGVVALLLLLAAAPILVLMAWQTEPIPSGELRARLETISDQLGVRVRSIRVWDERTRYTVNACAVGMVPGLRIVIFTRGIFEVLGDEEIAAVFAHEAAHLARGHLLAYAGMGLAFLFSLAPFLAVFPQSPAWIAWSGLAAYAGIYWIGGLGAISRRMEVEADFVAAEAAGQGAYASALRKAASWVGPAARKNGWRHFSLDRRLELLGSAAKDPQVAASALCSCRRARRALVLLLAISVGGFAWSLSRESPAASSPIGCAEEAAARIEEAESMKSLLAHASIEGEGSFPGASWLRRDATSIEADYRKCIDSARSALELAERSTPAEAVPLRARLEKLLLPDGLHH